MMSWQNGFDGQGWIGPVAKLYNVKTVPRAFLIGADGKLLEKDLLFHPGPEMRVKNEVDRRQAAILKQKAEAEAKRKADEAAKAAAEKAAAEKK